MPGLVGRLTIGAAAAMALIGSACPKGSEMDRTPGRSTDLPRPVAGGVAVRAELDAARRAGTVEAYDLFLARHPDHPLAETAGRERAELLRRSRR
jgi:hypothetical protein